MTDLGMSFNDFLLHHRGGYLRTLPGRFAQLDALAGQIVHAEQRAAALPALELCAHSLAGSAGTFGFHALGAAARTLELAVGEARAEGEAPANTDAGPVLAALADLRRQHQALAADPQPETTE